MLFFVLTLPDRTPDISEGYRPAREPMVNIVQSRSRQEIRSSAVLTVIYIFTDIMQGSARQILTLNIHIASVSRTIHEIFPVPSFWAATWLASKSGICDGILIARIRDMSSPRLVL